MSTPIAVDTSSIGLLKLEDLYKVQERHWDGKKRAFDEILKQCHRRIMRVNHQLKVYQCHFQVPSYVFGYPTYKSEEVVEYICNKLSKNGFLVFPEDDRWIYISWAPEEIDFERYQKSLKKITSIVDYSSITNAHDNADDADDGATEKPETSAKASKPKPRKHRSSKPQLSNDHNTMVMQFDTDFEDMIPINRKKLGADKTINKKYPWNAVA